MENEKSTLTVLMVEPGKAPYQAAIGADLKSLQQVVGGYIESISPYDDPVAIICNEEGKLEQLPFNRGLRDESGNLYDFLLSPKSSTLQTAGLKFCRIRPLNSKNLKNRI